MATTSFQCRCGALRGTLERPEGSRFGHVVCYCSDCRAFVRWLGRDDLLDAGGGTEILQLAPSQVRLETRETLACMRLTEGGLHRFYASCCRTPFANAVSARVPFVGLSVPGLGLSLSHAPAGIQGGSAQGPTIAGTRATASLRVIGDAVGNLSSWWWHGAGRPSPVFDDEGAPRVRVEVIARSERERLRRLDHAPR
ncbi:MAG: DUF6151 family protein [Sandaracinus sp.]